MNILYYFLLLLLVFLVRRAFHERTKLPLPPGPVGSYFTGIKDDLPSSEPWKTYATWSNDYESTSVSFSSRPFAHAASPGPIISFKIHHTRTVILNTPRAVHDLLSIRADIYSDRPHSRMYHDICARGKSVFNVSSRNPRHKIYHRLLADDLGTRAKAEWWDVMGPEIDILVDGLKTSPERYEAHIRRYVGFFKPCICSFRQLTSPLGTRRV